MHPLIFSSLFCARRGWSGSTVLWILASGRAGLIIEGLQGRSLTGSDGEESLTEVLLLLVLPVELLRAGWLRTPKVTVLIGEILCSAFSLSLGYCLIPFGFPSPLPTPSWIILLLNVLQISQFECVFYFLCWILNDTTRIKQYLLLPHFMSRQGIIHVFNHFRSHKGKMVSCFNLYIFDYHWVWTSVHMLIGYLHISFNCLLIFFTHFSFG